MQIAVDASSLLINPFSGLSQVVHSLLLHLPAVDSGKRFVLYLNYFRKHLAGKDISYPGTTRRYFKFPRRPAACLVVAAGLASDRFLFAGGGCFSFAAYSDSSNQKNKNSFNGSRLPIPGTAGPL